MVWVFGQWKSRAWALLMSGMLCVCLFVTSGLRVVEVNAMGKLSKLRIARLDVGKSDPRPTAIRRLLWEVDKRTSLRPVLEPATVKVSDAALFQYPLVFLSGSEGFAKWSDVDIVRMRSYLVAGGTLYLDMSEGQPGSAFDLAVRRLASRLFPQKKLEKLTQKHTLFKSFYLIRRFGGRVLQSPYVEGITQDDRTMLLYSMNDLHGAWERDNFGNWTHPVVPGGDNQREHAFRFGINIVMYALCVNYKADMVHVPFIMRRRK